LLAGSVFQSNSYGFLIATDCTATLITHT